MNAQAQAVARWSPFRWLSPGGRGGRLQIFIFHRVLASPDPLLPDEPDAERFDALVGWIARHFQVLPLAAAADRLAHGTLPAAAACITFDDGYADNFSVALPILRRHGVTATFFVATGFIGGGRMWNDSVIESVRRAPDGVLDLAALGLGQHALNGAASRVAAYSAVLKALKHQAPERRAALTADIATRAGLPAGCALMMSPDQLRGLRDGGMDIGGHTVTHPILSTLQDGAARAEIDDGRRQLADWLGAAPTVFAYPNGVPTQDYTGRDVALVREAGYTVAVSTSPGAASHGADLLQLPRFTPWDRDSTRFALRCALNIRRSVPRLA
jgi:peptidoglycan/xylan/chitin deacetylase (PgdA/CDA1 family)